MSGSFNHNVFNEEFSVSGSFVDTQTSSDQTMNSKLMTNNTNVTDNKQFTPKSYVDAVVTPKVNKSGDALTGHLTTNQTSFSANQLVTKQYVDTQNGSLVAKAGSSLTGHLTTNQTSFSANQLVTKQYVDSQSSSFSGTSGNYKFLNQGSNNTTQYLDINLKSALGSGTSLTALDGYSRDGSQLNSQRGGQLGSTDGHFVLKTFNSELPLDHTRSGNDQEIQVGFKRTSSSDDGKFLKYVHNGVPTWDTPAGSSGASSFTTLADTPTNFTNQAGMMLQVNSTNNGVEFTNPTLQDEDDGVSGAQSIKATTHSKTNNTVKMIAPGTNVTFDTSDPNTIKINSSGSGGAGGVTIDDSSTSTTKVWSSDKTSQQILAKAPLSHTHAISDIVNLTTSLQAKMDDTQIKTAQTSSSTTDVYSTSYINALSLFDGNYNSLSNKPSLFSGSYVDLSNKPSLFSGSYVDLSNKPAFHAVSTSGSYNDLINRPTLFNGDYTSLSNKPSLFSGSYVDLSNKPTLFSGSYVDLSNKPTLLSLTPTTNRTTNKILKYDGTTVVWGVDNATSGGSADGVLGTLNLSNGVLTATLADGTTQIQCDIESDDIKWKYYTALSDLPTAGSGNHGMIAHVHNEASVYFSHSNAWHKLSTHGHTHTISEINNLQGTLNSIVSDTTTLTTSVNNLNTITTNNTTSIGLHTTNINNLTTTVNNIPSFPSFNTSSNAGQVFFIGDSNSIQVGSKDNYGFSTDRSKGKLTTSFSYTNASAPYAYANSQNTYDLLPALSGSKYLYNDGTNLSWQSVNLPSISTSVNSSPTNNHVYSAGYINTALVSRPVFPSFSTSSNAGQFFFVGDSNSIQVGSRDQYGFSTDRSKGQLTTTFSYTNSSSPYAYANSQTTYDLLPALSASKFLYNDGTNISWASVPGGSTDTFVSSGVVNSSSQLVLTKSDGATVTISGIQPELHSGTISTSGILSLNQIINGTVSTVVTVSGIQPQTTIPNLISANTSNPTAIDVYGATYMNTFINSSETRDTALETKTQNISATSTATVIASSLTTSSPAISQIHQNSTQNFGAGNTVSILTSEGVNSQPSIVQWSHIATKSKIGTSGAEYGQVTMSAIENGTMTEKVHVGKGASGDSDVVINGELKTTGGIKFNDATSLTTAGPISAITQNISATSSTTMISSALTVASTAISQIHQNSTHNFGAGNTVSILTSEGANSQPSIVQWSHIATKSKIGTSGAEYGQITMSAIENGTMTEKVHVGKGASGDSDVVINGQLKTTSGIKFADGTTLTTAPGGPAPTQVDPLTFGSSGGSNTTHNSVTQTPDQHRYGITFGDRRFKWFVEDHLLCEGTTQPQRFNPQVLINGIRGDSSPEPDAANALFIGGHVTFTPANSVQYKFRGIRFYDNGWNTASSMINGNWGLFGASTQGSQTADMRFAAFGLKDGKWIHLGTMSGNNKAGSITAAHSMQSGTPTDVTIPTTQITNPEYSQTNNAWTPTPSNLITGTSGNVLWQFSHNIDFYDAYRIKHVNTGYTVAIEGVTYQKLWTMNFWELEFWAGAGT